MGTTLEDLVRRTAQENRFARKSLALIRLQTLPSLNTGGARVLSRATPRVMLTWNMHALVSGLIWEFPKIGDPNILP